MKRKILCLSAALLVSCMTFTAAQTQQRPAGQSPQQTQSAKATIEGTVTRVDNGQPLKGARVSLRRAAQGQNAFANAIDAGELRTLITNFGVAFATVTTDGSGRFLFTGIDAGQYQISAEREGFVRSEYGQRTPTGNGIAVPVSANQHLTLDLKMLQASVVSGRVITSDGEPATQATVQAYTYRYTNGQRNLAEVRNTRTNDLGEYRLFWLEPGDYFVSVTSNETANGVPVGTVDVSQGSGRGDRGGAAGLQFLASALGDRGGPIVQVLGGATNPPVFYPGTLDPDSAIPITVAAAAEVRGTDFNLRPTRAATLSGRVTAPFPLGQGNTAIAPRGRGAAPGPDGNALPLPLAAAPVQLSLTRVGGSGAGLAGLFSLRLGSTPVAGDGSFEIRGVAPGEYNLTATGRDPNGQQYTGRTRVNVSTADVTNVAVALRPGVEVRGKIILDGTPPQQFKISNLRVNLVAEDSPLAGGINFAAAQGGRGDAMRVVLPGSQASTAEVADDGSFTLKDVGAMEYRIRLTGLPQGAYIQAGRIESKDALNSPFTVDSQGSLLQLQLGFSPGRVSGTISDAKGTVTPGVQAVLVPDESRRGRSDAYFTATTDQNGQFTFSSVPPGRYKLFAWEDIPPGAYQYADFLRRYEDRGQSITVNASGAVTADARLIPAN